MARAKVSLVIVPVLFTVIHCVCQKTYITKCPSFEDFKNYEDATEIEELMIGTEAGVPKMTSVSLTDVINYNKYTKLSTVYIVNAVNQLEPISNIPYRKNSVNYVNFYGNVLKNVETSHFPKLRLRKLSLVNNQIETIALKNQKIQELDLSDNRLEVIASESLPPTCKVITIRNNRLVHLEEEIFHQRLLSLDLERNFLRFVRYEVLEKLVNLRNLDLSHNKFTIVPSISHMQQLKIFDISHNLITGIRLSTFRNMSSLVLIDLSYNNIYQPGIFIYLSSLKTQDHLTVLLAGNQLKTTSGEKKFEKKTYSLYGNPWYCRDFAPMMHKFQGHLSKCDLEFSNQGDMPYCVDIYGGDGYDPSDVTKVKNFVDMVKANAGKFKCAENLKKEKKLAMMEFENHVCHFYGW